MSFDIAAMGPAMIAISAAGATVIVVAVGLTVLNMRRTRSQKRQIGVVTDAIIDYFRKSGVGVAVGCTSMAHNRFTVLIESEPMKRFRLSHIIEATLRDHVKKACGLEVDKIYWRFPIKHPHPAEETAKDKEGKPKEAHADEYINEGLVNYRHLPKVEAEELSWENFEAASGKLEQTTTQ